MWSARGAVGSAAGPVLGCLLVGFVGWRSIFLINLPIGLIGIWLTLRFIDQTTNRSQLRRGPDLGGQTLAIFALVGLVGAIIEAGSLGWRAPLVLFGVVLAVLPVTGLIIVEAKSGTSAVPLELFRNSGFSAATIVGFAVNLTVYGSIFAFALYFQHVMLFSPVETGLAFLPFALAMTMANFIGGRITARFWVLRPLFLGLFVVADRCVLLFVMYMRKAHAAM